MSAYVDSENGRYGIVRDMISAQDAVNKRESKLLHQLTSRQTIGIKGAVVSVAEMKRQLALPDGHVELDADAVCGCIGVADWSAHGDQAGFIRDHFAVTYHEMDGHRHIHGANLGVSAEAYERAGGFQPLACSEDVALVEALQASGARIAWSAAPRVTTSARADARARGGFGDTLLAVIAAGLAATAVATTVQPAID